MIFSSDRSNHAIFSAGLPHHCLQQPGWQDPWRSTRPARLNDDIMDNDDNEDDEHDKDLDNDDDKESALDCTLE